MFLEKAGSTSVDTIAEINSMNAFVVDQSHAFDIHRSRDAHELRISRSQEIGEDLIA